MAKTVIFNDIKITNISIDSNEENIYVEVGYNLISDSGMKLEKRSKTILAPSQLALINNLKTLFLVDIKNKEGI